SRRNWSSEAANRFCWSCEGTPVAASATVSLFQLTMAGNITLTIIKPDAFSTGKAGKIIAHLEAGGFKIRAARVLHMTDKEAGAFYEVHRERPFYRPLVTFMTSGPCMPMVLQKANAVAELRTAIGATDPVEAAAG